ncbi:hypothetical protein MPER_04570, partial [Moniliophthora perniciosa FA553]
LPASQPRSLVGGHFIGALIGVGIARLFLLLPTDAQFEELQWTVHPPAVQKYATWAGIICQLSF